MIKIRFSLLIIVAIFSCEKKPNDHYVVIQGKKQHVLTMGAGKPVVVFICGLGGSLMGFDSVQKSLSRITKTFSYDRPGLGKSEMIDSPRTVENAVSELNQLLHVEGMDGPVILVGHSLGGHIARYYIHLHPEHVVGMVLIDPSNEFLWDEIMNTKTAKERKDIDSMIMNFSSNAPIGAQMEMKYKYSNDSLLRTFKIRTSIPITLIESIMTDNERFMTERVVKIKMNLYRQFQKQVPQMKIISTEKSGHFIQLSEPDLVIDAIKSIVNDVR